MMDDLTLWVPALQVIADCGAVSIPLVVAAGLVSRAFNALVSMVTGERRVRF